MTGEAPGDASISRLPLVGPSQRCDVVRGDVSLPLTIGHGPKEDGGADAVGHVNHASTVPRNTTARFKRVDNPSGAHPCLC